MDTRRSSIIRSLLPRLAAAATVVCLLTSFAEAGTGGDRKRLLLAAQDILDNDRPRYRFGAEGEGGKYDCSSFLAEAARRGGVGELPRTSRDQFDLLKDLGMVWTKGMRGWGNLLPGDLVFYSGTYGHDEENPISHVMIYAGGGMIVGAQSSGVGYHNFDPTPPMGDPGEDGKEIRARKTVYAYARPDWSMIRRVVVAGKVSRGRETIASGSANKEADREWGRASWDGRIADSRQSQGDGGWETGWDYSGEARSSYRTITPAVRSSGRGVWLP